MKTSSRRTNISEPISDSDEARLKQKVGAAGLTGAFDSYSRRYGVIKDGNAISDAKLPINYITYNIPAFTYGVNAVTSKSIPHHYSYTQPNGELNKLEPNKPIFGNFVRRSIDRSYQQRSDSTDKAEAILPDLSWGDNGKLDRDYLLFMESVHNMKEIDEYEFGNKSSTRFIKNEGPSDISNKPYEGSGIEDDTEDDDDEFEVDISLEKKTENGEELPY